ncbi:anti-sigma factor family protein [Motiliproteus sediminis]|uniref:anti-sigma factor family protein n=1 Tax=Motiliproteus sediminis TaxID=1468178 RepID=UPI001AF025D5|nr:anti-sigma factor [Motiliproteus sediminis]
MNQPVTEQDLHALVDGLLPPDRIDTVNAWLASHPEDAAKVADYRQINRELQNAYPTPTGDWTPARRKIPSRGWSAAAAMAALTLLGGVAGWQLNSYFQPPAAVTAADLSQRLVQPARVSHRVYTPEILHPVEVRREQQQHLVGWLSKRLGKPVKAPELAAQGFALIGGRLLPSTDGPAAQFMYENSVGQRLTLYVRQADDNKEQTAFRRYSADGLSSFYWVDNGLGYALTGDIGPDALMESANQVYRQLTF